tara:strand:- start:48 stop:533 length:486 start_codon:yes stop_codon:yes gene_type:complete
MNNVYIQLGGNLGNRKGFLEKACELISENIGQVVKKSMIYESTPWGVGNQGYFLNQVLLIKTRFNPFELLEKILEIEKIMGRIRLEKWGERIIDIDVLFYDDIILETETLCIPHSHISKRRFVLKPMSDIASEYLHPKLNQTITELLEKCLDDEKVELYEE